MNKPLRVACIGAGSSGVGHMILLEKFVPGCCVAFSDPDRALFDEITAGYFDGCAASAAGDFKTDATTLRPDFRNLPYYRDTEEMFRKETFDTVVISTYCRAHAAMTELAIRHGKNILLEKPIAINEDDVEKLWRLLKNYPNVATVNFTMRGAPVLLSAQKHVRDGDIGKVVSVQYVNNVHYGDGYFRHWMRTRENVGDLFLQKATHDFDVINAITGLKPVSIAAFGSRLVYGGDMPDDLTCDDCDRMWSCPMSIYKRHLDAAKALPPRGSRKCVYAKEIDIDDNQVVIINYEGGVTASYSQTFNAPAQGGQRGGYFIGTEGIMQLHFYGAFEETPRGQILRGDSRITLTRHNGKPGTRIVEIHDWAERGHFDGTEYVMLAKLDLLRGIPNAIAGTMREGYISAKMCLAAQKSIETGTVVKLNFT